MRLAKTLAVAVAAACFLTGAASATPKHKAGDDATTEPAAIKYCADMGETVSKAEYTSASTISVTCTRRPTKGRNKSLGDVPAGATYVEVKATSTTNEYEWTLPAVLVAVTLTLLGSGDSTSGTN